MGFSIRITETGAGSRLNSSNAVRPSSVARSVAMTRATEASRQAPK